MTSPTDSRTVTPQQRTKTHGETVKNAEREGVRRCEVCDSTDVFIHQPGDTYAASYCSVPCAEVDGWPWLKTERRIA